MSRLRLVLPTTVLLLGFLAGAGSTFGKLEYTKLEKKPCITCHVTIQGKELNKTGKCYQKEHSLAVCLPKEK